MKTTSDEVEGERKKRSGFDKQKEAVLRRDPHSECRFQSSACVAPLFYCRDTHINCIRTLKLRATSLLIKQTVLTAAPLTILLLSTGVANGIHPGVTELWANVHHSSALALFILFTLKGRENFPGMDGWKEGIGSELMKIKLPMFPAGMLWFFCPNDKIGKNRKQWNVLIVVRMLHIYHTIRSINPKHIGKQPTTISLTDVEQKRAVGDQTHYNPILL